MRVRVLAILLLATLLPAAPPPASAAAGPWGTGPRVVHRSPVPPPEVTGIRVAHHPGFDRVVLDLDGRAPGYSVRYVQQLHRDGSGKKVDLLGPVSLSFSLRPANGHDENADSTLTTPRRTKWRLDQVRETAVIGDFEADFTLGVGLRHRSAFRVLTLHHPTRIVVDVRH
jgi:hypothetical protein